MTELRTSDIDGGFEELKSFHSSFHPFFRVNTRDVIKPSLQYQQGLLFGEKSKNMTNMEMTVPDCDHQSLQNFISDSKWDEEGVISEIQRRVSALIGNAVHGSVHLDESGYIKGGERSVGVKRQYCGRIGKVDNCQMGVFLGYALWNYRTLIDRRLYLPEDWVDDPHRRARCGVPEAITFKTKAELGWDMLLNTRKNGLQFGWVGMDTFYGRQPWFLDRLDDEDFLYIADIPIDTRVWLERPKLKFQSGKGIEGVILHESNSLRGSRSPSKCGRLRKSIQINPGSTFSCEIPKGKSSGAIWCVYVSIR